MSLPNWPAELPVSPLLRSFGRPEHHRKPVISEVEDGPRIARVQSLTRIKKFSYAHILTEYEYTVFENFVEVTLAQATGHFMMSVPLIGKQFVTRRCYIDDAKWEDEPVAAKPLRWRVSFTLCAFVAG